MASRPVNVRFISALAFGLIPQALEITGVNELSDQFSTGFLNLGSGVRFPPGRH
jgi:hypothetical protein